jgi:hypothetical protein
MPLHVLLRRGVHGFLLHRPLHEPALAGRDDRLLHPEEVLAAAGLARGDLLRGVPDERVRIEAHLAPASRHRTLDRFHLRDGRALLERATLEVVESQELHGRRRRLCLHRPRCAARDGDEHDRCEDRCPHAHGLLPRKNELGRRERTRRRATDSRGRPEETL